MLLTICGFITFLCGIGGVIAFIVLIATANEYNAYRKVSEIRSDQVAAAFVILLLALSGLYYVIKTKFGKKDTMADKIEIENDALRKKIEQKKLIKELKEMND